MHKISYALIFIQYFKRFHTLKLNLINLFSCTGQVGTDECQRQAKGSYILPPVVSGRLNTKGKFEFLFGRVEIRAKLPRGDWVYPRKFIVRLFQPFISIPITIQILFHSVNPGERREYVGDWTSP